MEARNSTKTAQMFQMFHFVLSKYQKIGSKKVAKLLTDRCLKVETSSEAKKKAKEDCRQRNAIKKENLKFDIFTKISKKRQI